MAVIEIHLKSIQNLFETLDPAPFREKALDTHAEAYLIESATEYPESEPLSLLIHGPADMAASIPEITDAIHANFHVAQLRMERVIRGRMRMGRTLLVMGLAVLFITLITRYALTDLGTKADLLGESLLIVGWVALWRPAELLLFDRLESRAERAVLERLAHIPVEFRLQQAEGAATASQ